MLLKKKRRQSRRRRRVRASGGSCEDEEEFTPAEIFDGSTKFFVFHVVSAKIIALLLFRQQIYFELSDLPFFIYQELSLAFAVFLLNKTMSPGYKTLGVVKGILFFSIITLAITVYTIIDNLQIREDEQLITRTFSFLLSLIVSLITHGTLWLGFNKDIGYRIFAVCVMFILVVCVYVFAGVMPVVSNVNPHPHVVKAVPIRYLVPLWMISDTVLTSFGVYEVTTRVAFLIPWFGELPDTLPYTLLTFSQNSAFADFHFFVEAPEVYSGFHFSEQEVIEVLNFKNIPPNVFIHIYPPFALRKKMLQAAKEALGSELEGLVIEELSNSKMQVDYVPFFPVVFEQQISNYSHWGWIDIDIMLGNLTKFIPRSALETFDVITLQDQKTHMFLSGALTIFKTELRNLHKLVDHERLVRALKTEYKKHVNERLFSYAVLKTESISVLISCSRDSDEKMIRSTNFALEKGSLYVYMHSTQAKDDFQNLLRRITYNGPVPIVWPTDSTVMSEDEKQGYLRRNGYYEYYRNKGQSRWVGRPIGHLVRVCSFIGEISALHIFKSWRPPVEDGWFQPLLALPAEEENRCHIDVLADWILNFSPRPCYKHDWTWHKDPFHYDHVCSSESNIIGIILDAMEAVAALDADVFLAEGSLISALRWGTDKREDDDMDFLVRARDRGHWEQVLVPAIAREYAKRGFSLEPIYISNTAGKGFRYDKVSVMSPFRCHSTAVDIHSCMFTEDHKYLYSQRTCAGIDKLTGVEEEPCTIADKYPFSKWNGSIEADYFYPTTNCSFYGRKVMCPRRGGDLLKLWNWGEYSKGCIALPNKKISLDYANEIRANILKLDAKGYASFAPQVADNQDWENCKREAQVF
eukprot:TRINITY_DN3966_c0_g2_i1.p1 TRINITY_DN3966_c0_g2~~TRINITY_DN3966_c0_g2_i1.p1  ORF type:complete len:863 (+),score=146.88 TRINITY_DN3966_c0_g2_i1:288-2876(+)